MFTYFRYLSKVIFSKIPLWLMVTIGYIFAIIFLIVIPALTKTSPILMWNFDMINIQTTFVTIEAIKSGLLVGYAFKNDVEDGSELIIYSKPLKRIKILLPKLLWVILASFLFSVGYVLIALCTMAFGQYDAISRPSGMPYDKILALVASLIIGPFINSLIFSSLAVFIGTFGNKLKIFITVTLIAIVLSIYDVIGSVIMTSKSSNIVSKNDGKITSFSVWTNDLKSNNFAYYNTLPAIDLYEANKTNSDMGNFIYQILNINYQLSNFYKLFNLDNVKTTLESSEYGQYPKFKSIIENKDDTLLNFLETIYNEKNQNLYPYIIPISTDIYAENSQGDHYNNLGYLFLGLDSNVASWLKYFGAYPHDIWVSNLTVVFDIIPSTYVSDENLINVGNINEFDTNVYNNIIFDILTNEDFINIFNVVNNIEYARNAQNKFDHLCYQFILNNKEKYGFLTDNLANVNLSMAKIQYSMIRQFCMIYWTQIIQQLVKRSEYNVVDYLKNTNNQFQNSFAENVEISNPYMDYDTFEISVDTFTRCFLAYSGVGQINFDSKFSIQRFGYSCYGIDEHGEPLIDVIPENYNENYYFMFPNQYVDIYGQQGYDITSVYKYRTSEFYTHLNAIIFWSIASFMFFACSMINYLRHDIS